MVSLRHALSQHGPGSGVVAVPSQRSSAGGVPSFPARQRDEANASSRLPGDPHKTCTGVVSLSADAEMLVWDFSRCDVRATAAALLSASPQPAVPAVTHHISSQPSAYTFGHSKFREYEPFSLLQPAPS